MGRRRYEHPLKGEVRTAGALFSTILAACWACALWGGPTWMFEIAANFAVPVALVALSMALALLWARGWPWLGVSLATALWSASLPLGWHSGEPPGAPAHAAMEGAPDTLRFAVLNVLSSNATQERVVEQVLERDPDVLLLLETTPAWASAIAQLSEDRPYVVSEPRGDNFGITLMSKHPYNRARKVNINLDLGPAVPAVHAEVRTPLGPLTLLGVHTFPPVDAEATEMRRMHLLRAAELARVTEGPVVVMGDLNTSMSTRSYRLFEAASGLENARKGRGWLGTWPAGAPAWLRIPLDHVMHNDEVLVHELEVLPLNGSDHLGLVADISLDVDVPTPR